MTEPTVLPFFPLGLVCFPGEALRLHIFEPRYRQLLTDCEQAGLTFVIPTVESGTMYGYGTEVGLAEITKRYPTGESDIVVLGRRVARVEHFRRELGDKPYPGGGVAFVDNDPTFQPEMAAVLESEYQRFHAAIGSGNTRTKFDVPNLSFAIGHEVGLELAQQVELLRKPREADRQPYLVDHLRRLTAFINKAQSAKRRQSGNGFHRSPPDSSH